MNSSWSGLTDKLGSIAGKWTAYTAFGTFLIYLLGYLTLRFQLSTYGVATDLDVFDEKYLFAGSRFLVYLVTSVPNVLVVVLALVVLGYLPYLLFPASAKGRLTRWRVAWRSKPQRIGVVGTVFALAMIQLLLRKCFVFGNLLLATRLPEYEWINGILLGDPAARSLYFSGLVGGTLLTGGLLLLSAERADAPGTSLSQAVAGVLVFLFAVEFLLLPVNYGILIASQELPRVSEIGTDDKIVAGQRSWLVWETKDALTYLVQDSLDSRRTLLTIPRKDSRIKIVAYDNIFRALFAPAAAAPVSSGGNTP
jgi:hypothetical protein